jgi:hypothetical protein
MMEASGRQVEIIGTAGRKASFTDADGNELSFIEVAAPRAGCREP